MLATAGDDLVATPEAQQLRDQKEKAIDAQNLQAAARLGGHERHVRKSVTAALGLDVDDARARAELLIETARSSLRGDSVR